MDEENSNLSLLLHEKPVLTILSLKGKEKYASVLAKETNCTYTHTLKILSLFEKYGLISSEKDGRINKIKLTEKGEELAHDLEGIVRHLEHLVENSPEA